MQMWWSRKEPEPAPAELCKSRAESLGGLSYFLDFCEKFERGFSKDLAKVVKELRKYGKSTILLPASTVGLFMESF